MNNESWNRLFTSVADRVRFFGALRQEELRIFLVQLTQWHRSAKGTGNARHAGVAIGEKMESALWMINLLALVYLCFWAIRQDKSDQPTGKED